MVKETPVLQERTVVRISVKTPTFASVNTRPRTRSSRKITLDCIPERFLYQSAPGFAGDFVNLESARHFFPGNQRLEHRVPDVLRAYLWQCVEAFQLVVLEWCFRSAQTSTGGPPLHRNVAQKHAPSCPCFMYGVQDAIARRRSSSFKPRSWMILCGNRLTRDPVPRQARFVIRKDLLRSRRAADVIIFFQQQHAESSSAKISGGNQAIMTCAQYDDIIVRFHFEFGGECMLTSNIARQTSNIS